MDAWVEGRGGDGRDRVRKRRGERNYKETREIYRHKHAHQFHCVHAVLPKPIQVHGLKLLVVSDSMRLHGLYLPDFSVHEILQARILE